MRTLTPERASEIGKKGGSTTSKRHGLGHYFAIGKKGGDKLKAERGTDYYREIGMKRWANRSDR